MNSPMDKFVRVSSIPQLGGSEFVSNCNEYCNEKDIENFCSMQFVDYNENNISNEYISIGDYEVYENFLYCFLVVNCTYQEQKIDMTYCEKTTRENPEFSSSSKDSNILIGIPNSVHDINYDFYLEFPFKYHPNFEDYWYIKQFSINGTTYSVYQFLNLTEQNE